MLYKLKWYRNFTKLSRLAQTIQQINEQVWRKSLQRKSSKDKIP